MKMVCNEYGLDYEFTENYITVLLMIVTAQL